MTKIENDYMAEVVARMIAKQEGLDFDAIVARLVKLVDTSHRLHELVGKGAAATTAAAERLRATSGTIASLLLAYSKANAFMALKDADVSGMAAVIAEVMDMQARDAATVKAGGTLTPINDNDNASVGDPLLYAYSDVVPAAKIADPLTRINAALAGHKDAGAIPEGKNAACLFCDPLARVPAWIVADLGTYETGAEAYAGLIDSVPELTEPLRLFGKTEYRIEAKATIASEGGREAAFCHTNDTDFSELPDEETAYVITGGPGRLLDYGVGSKASVKAAADRASRQIDGYVDGMSAPLDRSNREEFGGTGR